MFLLNNTVSYILFANNESLIVYYIFNMSKRVSNVHYIYIYINRNIFLLKEISNSLKKEKVSEKIYLQYFYVTLKTLDFKQKITMLRDDTIVVYKHC